MKKIKFPKEAREKWLKALRGGRYKQTDGSLLRAHENSYCCLGVLGRVLKVKKEDLAGIGDFTSHEIPFAVTCKIPTAIVKVNKKELTRKNTNFATKLIDMNDEDHCNFLEIADYIEKNTVGV